MTYLCDICKKIIEKLDENLEPLFRKQTFVNGKRIVVCGYCGPECSVVAYEQTRSKRSKKLKI